MSEERDLIERLKERVVYDANHNPPADPLHAEAASEITRLRAQVREAVDGAQPLWSGEIAADKAELLRLRGEVERLTAERGEFRELITRARQEAVSQAADIDRTNLLRYGGGIEPRDPKTLTLWQIAERLEALQHDAPKPGPARNFSLPEGPFTVHHLNETTGEVTQINPDGSSQRVRPPLSGIFGRTRRSKSAPKPGEG